MANDEDRAAKALDDLLQRAVKQGYLDPMAGRAARSGVERLRTFLGNAAAEGRSTPGEEAVTDAEVVEEVAPPVPPVPPVPPGSAPAGVPADPGAAVPAGTTRIPVALRGGRRAELLLPERFDAGDAERIASVVHALALDDLDADAAG